MLIIPSCQMQKLGLYLTSNTYDSFVKAIVSERGFSSGMEVVMYISFPYAVISSNCFDWT